MRGSPLGESAAWQPAIAQPLAGGAVRVEQVAAEEPLEIRVRGTVLAVLLRTPGRERDLIAGFLLSEGIVRGPEDLGAIEPCSDPETRTPAAHVWNVALAEGVAFDPRRARAGLVGSSCGMCGALQIEELMRLAPRRGATPGALAPSAAALAAAFAELRGRQALFAMTAGTHGAALAEPHGDGLRLSDVAEDVGRHNAADKVLGARLRAGAWPLAPITALLVSGRISYEIIHKSVLAGAGLVAGVGMPTSLAVSAARAAGIGLCGFVREAGGLVYSPAPRP